MEVGWFKAISDGSGLSPADICQTNARRKPGFSHGKCCSESGSWVYQWVVALNCRIGKAGKDFPFRCRAWELEASSLPNRPVFNPISEQDFTFHVKFIPQFPFLPQFPVHSTIPKAPTTPISHSLCSSWTFVSLESNNSCRLFLFLQLTFQHQGGKIQRFRAGWEGN